LERRLRLPDTLPSSSAFAYACRNYLEHRFDVLGSGWLSVRHGMECPGVEGHRYPSGPSVQADVGGQWLAGRVTNANLAESRRRWRLVSDSYIPMDWHIDLKSGFRWSPMGWYHDAPYGHMPGVDIKVPWELARGHYLPQLSLYADASEDPAVRAHVAREVCDQICDFMAQNPPRFGPNWLVAMDVGIRVANWCVAVDLLRAARLEIAAEVEQTISRGIFEHGAHIAAHLEWFPHLRSNHYLGNLVGLVFAGAYLPPSREADSWLSFAAAALLQEAGRQFNADGSNFEGSVAYHRLSTEALVYCLALLRRLPEERASHIGQWDPCVIDVPERPPVVTAGCLAQGWLDELLERAANFVLDATRPDGRIVQIGDTDSGRIFKLDPVLTLAEPEAVRATFPNLDGWIPQPRDGVYVLEEHLDCRHLAAAAGALTKCAELEARARAPVEAACVRAFAPTPRSVLWSEPRTARRVPIGEDVAFKALALAAPSSAWLERTFKTHEEGILDGLDFAAYPDFGLWVFRSPRLYLAVRCGSVGQNGAGGHSHNDQLAMELWIDGGARAIDPGTYLYTPLPGRRNEYRSVAAHDAPQLGVREPALLTHGLFQLQKALPGTCVYFGPRGFVGWHDGYGERVTRWIELGSDAVTVRDWAESGETPRVAAAVPLFSPGYGQRLGRGASLHSLQPADSAR
jgi:hypothetical protein